MLLAILYLAEPVGVCLIKSITRIMTICTNVSKDVGRRRRQRHRRWCRQRRWRWCRRWYQIALVSRRHEARIAPLGFRTFFTIERVLQGEQLNLLSVATNHLSFSWYFSMQKLAPTIVVRSGGSRGGSMGSDEPPFLTSCLVLSLYSSVKSRLHRTPHAFG